MYIKYKKCYCKDKSILKYIFCCHNLHINLVMLDTSIGLKWRSFHLQLVLIIITTWDIIIWWREPFLKKTINAYQYNVTMNQE